MKTPSLLLLLPLGLAIGYGAGYLRHGEPPPNAELPHSVETQPQQTTPTASQKQALWRSRFLKILEEPSFSLQSATYYAVAKDLSVADMPYFLEGMYPEGWTRFRGDLPLAIYMQWAKRDSAGLALFTQNLIKKYPDLHDNLDGVYFNLGLQNSPGAVESIDAISDTELRAFLATQFIDGISRQHPEAVFPIRLRLLGPQATFSNLSPQELPQAVADYWTNARRYIEQSIQPSTQLAIELGRRYQNQAIQRFAESNKQAAVLTGSIVSTGSLPENAIELLNSTWFNWHEIESYLNNEEKHALLSYLSQQESYWKENQSGIGQRTIRDGIDRDIAERLLSLTYLDKWIRNQVVTTAGKLYTKSEFLKVLAPLDGDLVQSGLFGLLNSGSATDGLSLLADLPKEWQSQDLINQALEKALKEGSPKTFQELCSLFPEHQRFLPDNPITSAALWRQNPELYLRNIESVHGSAKERQLQMIASEADDEELGMILESGTFDQQTDVLIGLIQTKPFLSTEILKHEDPSLVSQQQASTIGSSLANQASAETSLSYFKSSDIDQPSSQIAALSYYVHEAPLGAPNSTSQQIAQLSPQHEYLYRTANAFRQETDNPSALIALKQENPEVFINVLTAMIDRAPVESLRSQAQNLLASPALTTDEKLKVHDALYGGYHR